jgi:hypothetical protein
MELQFAALFEFQRNMALCDDSPRKPAAAANMAGTG